MTRAHPLILAAVLLLGLTAHARTQGVPAPDQPTSQSPAPSPAAPQDRPPADDNSRYSFHRMGEGFIRLDGRTGQLAQCGWSAAGWSCKSVPEERSALEGEIVRLQRENAALKRSLLERGLALPRGVVADAPAASHPVPPPDVPGRDGAQAPRMPSEAELDRAFAFVKNVWRRLVEMMVELQRDIQRKS